MKLEEIIEKVKHDADYFTKAQNLFQSGRCFEAQKILDMLYLIEPAQLQQHVVVRGGVNEANSVSIPYDYNNTVTVAKPPSTPTGLLGNEAGEKGVRVDFWCQAEMYGKDKCNGACSYCHGKRV